MPRRRSATRLILPQGELRRFQIPETEEVVASRRPSRGMILGLLMCVWASFCVLLWHWTNLAWGPLDAFSAWLSDREAVAEQSTPRPPAFPQVKVKTHARLKTPAEPQKAAAPRLDAPLASFALGPRMQRSLPAAVGRHHGGIALLDVRDPGLPSSGVELPPVPEDRELSYTERNGVAHWARGCEFARKHNEHKFGRLEKIEALTRRLTQRAVYHDCKIPTSTAVSICATIVRGRAKGVTVYSEPPNLYVAGCVAAAVSREYFAVTKAAQMVRAELFWD